MLLSRRQGNDGGIPAVPVPERSWLCGWVLDYDEAASMTSAQQRVAVFPDNLPYKLPNGCWLYKGGRVRVPKDDIWSIPLAVIESLGLELEDESASPGSEVVRWP